MNRVELQAKLGQEDLLVVYDRGSPKYYVDESKVFVNGEWENMVDVFGIYKWDSDNYVCFMTDSERGMPYYNDVYDTESEACQKLYEMAVRLKSIHIEELASVALPAIPENEEPVVNKDTAKTYAVKYLEKLMQETEDLIDKGKFISPVAATEKARDIPLKRASLRAKKSAKEAAESAKRRKAYRAASKAARKTAVK